MAAVPEWNLVQQRSKRFVSLGTIGAQLRAPQTPRYHIAVMFGVVYAMSLHDP